MVTISQGDCMQVLPTLAAGSVNCCVTSPPYWGLRSYLAADDPQKPLELGSESTPEEYVARMVEVFREVRRVLREDGTLWLNLGDTYATGAGRVGECPGGGPQGEKFMRHFGKTTPGAAPAMSGLTQPNRLPLPGLKPKDLIGIPWRVAFALQADGWWLRSDIVWHKPNCMPESVTDRPTRTHEYIFLLTKSARYYYDAAAIAERAIHGELFHGDYSPETGTGPKRSTARNGRKSVPPGGFGGKTADQPGREAFRAITQTRNKRDVWTVPTAPYSGAHFATFPPALITPCVLAGCPQGGTVLDPFGGSGTTGEVAEANGRNSVLIELSPQYVELARRRTAQQGLFCNP